MTKMIIAFLAFISLAFAGGQPEVTLKEEKDVIKASHTVFMVTKVSYEK